MALLVVCTPESEDGGSATDERPLIFAAVPHRDRSAMQHLFQPILDMLRDETGREVTLLSTPDYATLVDMVVEGEVNIAELGPLSYVIAQDRGARVSVASARTAESDESPVYRSYGITRSGSSIRTLEDFRGHTVCFTDRNSTSGHLYPSVGLLDLGIDPADDIEPVFVGGHDASVLAVANGECDAGFALDVMVDRELIEQGQLQPGQVVQVWESEDIPAGPMVISEDLPETLRHALTNALENKATSEYLREQGYCNEECTIDDGDAYGFVPIDDAEYDGIREICRRTRSRACVVPDD